METADAFGVADGGGAAGAGSFGERAGGGYARVRNGSEWEVGDMGYFG